MHTPLLGPSIWYVSSSFPRCPGQAGLVTMYGYLEFSSLHLPRTQQGDNDATRGFPYTVGRQRGSVSGIRDSALLLVRSVRSLRSGEGYGGLFLPFMQIRKPLYRGWPASFSRYRGLQKLQRRAHLYQARQSLRLVGQEHASVL